jgi:hypothetical protein
MDKAKILKNEKLFTRNIKQSSKEEKTIEPIIKETKLKPNVLNNSKVKAENDTVNTENEAKSEDEAKRSHEELIKNEISVLKDVLYNSTAQGILRVLFHESLLVKIFWTLCLIFSIALCSYLTFEQIASYFDYKVNSGFRIYVESPAVFPSIIICDANIFKTEYAFSFLQQVIENKNLTNIFDQNIISSINDNSFETNSTYILEKVEELTFAAKTEIIMQNMTSNQTQMFSAGASIN